MDINEQIELQIEEEKKSVDYDTREFTIEIVVDKYLKILSKMIMKSLFLIINVSLHGMSKDSQSLLNPLF